MGNEENLAITPKGVEKSHVESIPKEVFQAVNELLVENGCRGGEISILQKTIVSRAMKLMKEAGKKVKRSDFFNKHWMDFEPYYEKKGWKVVYDGPAYCECYEPRFIFTPIRKRS